MVPGIRNPRKDCSNRMKTFLSTVSLALLIAVSVLNKADAQNGFADDFELYPAGSFPTNWLQSGNNAISVDNSTSYAGTNSLSLFGVLGGCSASTVHRNVNITPPWQLVCYVKNGGERGTGCHPFLGSIALNTGPSSTLPGFGLVFFRAAAGETNQLQIPSPVDNSSMTVASFNTNQWYKIGILYEPINTNQVQVTYWLNDNWLAGNLYSNLASSPTNFTYLALASNEGTAWFDDVSISSPTDSPPVIVQQPSSISTYQGASTSFTVLASGTTPLSYQWEFNGNIIPNETNSTLMLSNVQTNDEGSYAVIVTNIAGSVLSSNATLSVTNASSVSCSDAVLGLTGFESNNVAYTGHLIGYKMTASYAGGCQPSGVVLTNQLPSGFQFVSATTTQGSWTYDTNNQQLVFNVGLMPLNGTVSLEVSALAVQPGIFTTTAEIQYSSTNAPVSMVPSLVTTVLPSVTLPPSIIQQPVSVTTNVDATVKFNITATGTVPLSFQWWFQGNALPGATAAELALSKVQLNQDGLYWVVVTDSGGSARSSSASLTVIAPPTPPVVSITTPTNGSSFPSGTPIVIAAMASETNGVVTNVTFVANGTNTLGSATNAPYTFVWSNVLAGPYSLTATATDNNGLSSTSALVDLLVTNQAPRFLQQPVSVTTNLDATVNFNIAVSGTGPLSFQWWFQGVPLPGATNAELTLSSVQLNQDGPYWVVVTGSGGSAQSSSANLTVIAPATPPVVSIATPTNGSSFPSGASIVIAATASDTNGVVTNVTFLADGTNTLGSATNAPYTIVCSNVLAGQYSLTATATDNNGLSATSAAVNLLITNRLPSFLKGPDITAVQNSGPQSFTNWATAINSGIPNGSMRFTLVADNPGLFSAQPALGTDGTLSFTPAPGATGVANVSVVLVNSDGLSTPPQALTITVVGPSDVAIILASTDVDPAPVTNDVETVSLPAEQSLSFQTFQRSQLSSALLSLFKLVIWYDPNGTQPVSEPEVGLLQRVYSNGIPLIFVGPKLVSSGSGLSAQAQAAWQELLHLQPDGTTPISGIITPAGSSGSGTLLPSGAYGQITPFTIQMLVDEATVTPDADSDGQLGANDVLVSFPSANTSNGDQLVRTFTELLPLGQDSDGQSFTNRNQTLQNGICWVLNCGACPEVYLGFPSLSVDPAAPQTRVPATLKVTLNNGGECDGAAFSSTVRLASGLLLLSAQSDFGQVTTNNNVVTLQAGRIPARQDINITIEVLPIIPGWATNQIEVQSASSAKEVEQLVFEVQGARIALAIERSGPNNVLLSAWAQPGVSYVLQSASLQSPGPGLVWTSLTNFIFADPVFQMQSPIQLTNSGLLFRLRTD